MPLLTPMLETQSDSLSMYQRFITTSGLVVLPNRSFLVTLAYVGYIFYRELVRKLDVMYPASVPCAIPEPLSPCLDVDFDTFDKSCFVEKHIPCTDG